jgi:hypothetical protein
VVFWDFCDCGEGLAQRFAGTLGLDSERAIAGGCEYVGGARVEDVALETGAGPVPVEVAGDVFEGAAFPGIAAPGTAGDAREAAYGVVIPPGVQSACGEMPPALSRPRAQEIGGSFLTGVTFHILFVRDERFLKPCYLFKSLSDCGWYTRGSDSICTSG